MNEQKKSSAPPAAFVLVAIGGGVVGQDYAKWMEVSPLIGTIIGGVIGLILTKILYHLAADPEGKIKEACSGIGGLVGAVWGGYLGAKNSESGFAWLIGGFVGAIVGGIVGQMVAAFLGFSALLLLFLSQGPIGFALRAWFTSLNE